jgi:uncharacterized protein YkwD
MVRIKIGYLMFLLSVLVFAVGCSGLAEPTSTPTLEPTEVPAAQPTEAPEMAQVRILPSEIVIEKILVGELEADSADIEVVLQGHASNTCTTVDGVTVSRDEDIFILNVQTTVTTEDDCQDESVPFEEMVTVSTAGLTPGTYLISSGVLTQFEIAETEEQAVGESAEGGTGEGETPSEGETAAGEGESSGEGAAGTDEETAPVEPRDCEDLASFVSDVTYPDNTTVQAGESITKTWEISNQGTCTWGEGYALEVVSGAFSEVTSLSDPFPEAAPSETVQVSVVLTAPLTAGTHRGTWVIERPEGDSIEAQAGKAFDLWAIIRVATTTGAGTTDGSRTYKDGMVCAQGNSAYESQLLQLINTTRANNELPAYELQSQLTDAARELTVDMACNDFVDHTGTDGSDWFDRITKQGYAYQDAAENIRYGFGTVPELALSWWMDSDTHRGNILSSDLTQIGIAYALNPQNGASYYTLVFALPEEQE